MTNKVNMTKKRYIGILIGALAVIGVLVVTVVLGTPTQPSSNSTPNGGTAGTYPIECTGKSSIEVGRVRIGSELEPYILGETVTFLLPVHNGGNKTAGYSISCRQPDNPQMGYIKAPATVGEWFHVGDGSLSLPSCTGKDVLVSFTIPVDTPSSEFIVYYLTAEGSQYLEQARDSTIQSEDVLVAALKEELVGFPQVYAQFDSIYANKEDRTVMRALYDAFPHLEPEIAAAWERAVKNVKANLSAIPYASALTVLERLGSVSEAGRSSYPELSSLPPGQYVGSSDLRESPWEFWVTVQGEATGTLVIELACRIQITM